ncbi:MAG: TetR/AcrR family transcriptional regulator [Dehalococcoidia bacterium]
MTALMEPRTRKGWSTRRRIMDGAGKVFGRQGYTAARMLDIAGESGISLGAVYRYFRNKDDIFEAVILELDDELFLATHVDAGPGFSLATDPYHVMLLANRAHLEIYARYADVLRSLHEASSIEPRYFEMTLRARRRFRDRFLRRFQETHLSSSDGAAQQLVLRVDALIHMTDYLAYTWLAQPGLTGIQPAPDLETLATVITDIWHRSLFCGP